jgi:phosphoribosylanthranilate isomerase
VLSASGRTLIKICGITSTVDAAVVVDAGADALGLVFTSHSARQVDLDTGSRISRAVAGRITRVGLFVDPQPAEVEAVLRRVDVDLLQFHGEEPQALCGSFGLPYLKAYRVAGRFSIDPLVERYPDACALLLDTYVAGQAGGTGQPFDWALWPGRSRLPLMLAGGLTPENIAGAVLETRPWAVDVSGGVEGERKGLKDAARIERFIAEVRRADQMGRTGS